jgi:Winged helix-turn helix
MTKDQKIIRAKVGLLELAKQLGNVSQACKMLGYSRDSFYRFKELYDTGGDLALAEMSRRKPILKNRTPPEIEAQIVALSLEQPAYGQVIMACPFRLRPLLGAARSTPHLEYRLESAYPCCTGRQLVLREVEPGFCCCSTCCASRRDARAPRSHHACGAGGRDARRSRWCGACCASRGDARAPRSHHACGAGGRDARRSRWCGAWGADGRSGCARYGSLSFRDFTAAG